MNFIKGIIKWSPLILLAVVGVLVYLLLHKKPEIVTLASTNPVVLSQLQSYKDNEGKLYAKINQQQLDANTAKVYTDSLEKALKLGKSSIKEVDVSVSKDSIVYVDKNTKPVFATDTTNKIPIAYFVRFKDAWVDIKATAGKDTGLIQFTDVDTLTRVLVDEKHLFRPTTHTIFLGNSNPHNKIDEGSSFVIKEKVPSVIILPTFSYTPFNSRTKFNVGISIGSPKFAIKF